MEKNYIHKCGGKVHCPPTGSRQNQDPSYGLYARVLNVDQVYMYTGGKAISAILTTAIRKLIPKVRV